MCRSQGQGIGQLAPSTLAGGGGGGSYRLGGKSRHSPSSETDLEDVRDNDNTPSLQPKCVRVNNEHKGKARDRGQLAPSTLAGGVDERDNGHTPSLHPKCYV